MGASTMVSSMGRRERERGGGEVDSIADEVLLNLEDYSAGVIARKGFGKAVSALALTYRSCLKVKSHSRFEHYALLYKTKERSTQQRLAHCRNLALTFTVMHCIVSLLTWC